MNRDGCDAMLICWITSDGCCNVTFGVKLIIYFYLTVKHVYGYKDKIIKSWIELVNFLQDFIVQIIISSVCFKFVSVSWWYHETYTQIKKNHVMHETGKLAVTKRKHICVIG